MGRREECAYLKGADQSGMFAFAVSSGLCILKHDKEGRGLHRRKFENQESLSPPFSSFQDVLQVKQFLK